MLRPSLLRHPIQCQILSQCHILERRRIRPARHSLPLLLQLRRQKQPTPTNHHAIRHRHPMQPDNTLVDTTIHQTFLCTPQHNLQRQAIRRILQILLTHTTTTLETRRQQNLSLHRPPQMTHCPHLDPGAEPHFCRIQQLHHKRLLHGASNTSTHNNSHHQPNPTNVVTRQQHHVLSQALPHLTSQHRLNPVPPHLPGIVTYPIPPAPPFNPQVPPGTHPFPSQPTTLRRETTATPCNHANQTDKA